jgi:hypothetical protein
MIRDYLDPTHLVETKILSYVNLILMEKIRANISLLEG